MASAVNSFSESGIIRRLRSKGIREADISDDDLLEIIQDSLETFLFYRPKVTITSSTTCLTTVADQPNYSKPTGALIIFNVGWNPDYSTSADAITDLYEQVFLTHLDTADTTIMELQYDQMSRLHHLFGGAWEIRNDEIWLEPTPTLSGTKVAVIYGTSRTLDELDRIADRRFMELCEANAMLAVGQSKLTGGGWRAGSFQVSEAVGRETMRVAEKKLAKVLDQLANSYSIQTS